MKWLRRKYRQLKNYLTRDRNQQELPLQVKPKPTSGTLTARLAKMYNVVTDDLVRTIELERVVLRHTANKNRYKSVSDIVRVPWEVIAVINEMESSGRFDRALHNGQKIIGTDKKTTWVPKGRGPFDTWEESALDALKMKSHLFPAEWTMGNTLDFLERYNGLGYRKYHSNVNTPYLWSKTSYYDRGKYVSDGKWDSNAVSSQIGCVPQLIGLNYKVEY